MINLKNLDDSFAQRHISPSSEEIKNMLETIGVSDIDSLIDEVVPKSIQAQKALALPEAVSEKQFLSAFKAIASQNKVWRSYIGMGYYDCVTPTVIQRNILENPSWYTAYTPYQAEIAQGRLEALLNFQTMVCDLTGMELSNASLLDEATAAAEAVSLLFNVKARAKKTANTFLIDENVFPQTIDVIKGRAISVGINIVVSSLDTMDFENPDVFGVFLQYPNNNGAIKNPKTYINKAKENEVGVAVAADLFALTLLKPPGEFGVDAVVGTTQRFGIPLGYGGPHAAYFATKEKYKRQIPGRIIGVSEDQDKKPAYRMALQTREQHIKRERATSNICTAQVLLAVMAGMYAVYHGKSGVQRITHNIHFLTAKLNQELKKLGYEQLNDFFFDTLKIKVSNLEKIKTFAIEKEFNFRYFDEHHIGISLDEKTTFDEVLSILEIFAKASGKTLKTIDASIDKDATGIPEALRRESSFLEHPVFNSYQAEHEMLRYMKQLESKDLSLVHAMIPLGSCTMKLNATTEMIPLSWENFSCIHPFVPKDQASGYQVIFENLQQWLAEITGLYTTSLQPNSGAQGEYAGLMVIKAYFEHQKQSHRNITLIPSSAHGTNPASAVMAGQKVVIVKCNDNGDIDLEDLKEKAELHKDNLMALMITYPSTHGVFEENIKEACDVIHQFGGKVYMDGANLNAQVGITSPGIIGADVCHLNLHKTFCIPHGGGGPGMGPIAVSEALAPFIPGSAVVESTAGEHPINAISASPWGSASILTISYAYIAMMGPKGLRKATEIAILNANYIKAKLEAFYPVLYAGTFNRNAHELIIDCRQFKDFGVTVTDIAKRLMDYGFHAPTVSFPVAGTLMIEPTESESKEELDRFIEAMISIRAEIKSVENGEIPYEESLLKNAPHTMNVLIASHWDKPYSKEKAVFPLSWVKERKFWPSVSRINDTYGDRNLVCSCLPVEAYETETVMQ